MRRRLPLVLIGITLMLCARGAYAAWPVTLERFGPSSSGGILGLGADGTGGSYVSWIEQDAGGAFAFRVHRLDMLGDPPAGWTTAGVRAFAPEAFTGRPLLVPDDAGGTYLVWVEGYDPANAYVNRLAADGSLAAGWPARGLPVSDTGSQMSTVAIADGAGGVMLAWTRSGTGTTPEIVTQRFLADGTRAPGFQTAGRVLTTYANETGRFRPQIVRDGDLGFWVSFHTVGSIVVPGSSAYAILHLDPNGWRTAGQPANGLPLSLPAAEVGANAPPYAPVALALDGSGGTFAFTLGSNGNVRAFHVLPSLAEDPAWPVGGRLIAGGAGWPSVHFTEDEENWPVAAGDLAGGAWVGWRDLGDFLLHASRVEIDGTIAAGWTTPLAIAGEMVVTMLGDPMGVFAASLAPVGCPHFNCSGPMELVRMNLDGTRGRGFPPANPPSKPAPGVTLANGGPPSGPRLVDDGAGGVVAAWNEYPEYRAQRFVPDNRPVGVPSAPAGTIGIAARFDPDAGVRVSFSAGESRSAEIELFDVAGRRVASARVTAEAGEITLPGTRVLSRGVFVARLTVGAHTAVAKFVALQ